MTGDLMTGDLMTRDSITSTQPSPLAPDGRGLYHLPPFPPRGARLPSWESGGGTVDPELPSEERVGPRRDGSWTPASANPHSTAASTSVRRRRTLMAGLVGVPAIGLLCVSSASFAAMLVTGRAGDPLAASARFATSMATGLFGVLTAVATWLVVSKHRRARPTVVALGCVGLLIASSLLPHQPALGIAALAYLTAAITVAASGTTVISRRHPALDRSPATGYEGQPVLTSTSTTTTQEITSPERDRAASWRDRAGLLTTIALVIIALAVRPDAGIGLLIGAAIFVPLEKALPIRPMAATRAHWKTDAIHFLVNSLLTLAVLAMVLAAVYLLLGWAISPALQAAVRQQPGWLQFVEAIVISQVAFYGAHRAGHRIPFLWRFHQVHHSPVELDWLASARLHPVDLALGQAAVIVPLFAFGFSKETFGAYLIFSQLEAVFSHSNVRFRYGPLRWLIGGPLFHHWHHNDEPTARDVNFSGFPVIDWIFGTCYLPNRWPTHYGIGKPVPPTYLRQLAWPFRQQV